MLGRVRGGCESLIRIGGRPEQILVRTSRDCCSRFLPVVLWRRVKIACKVSMSVDNLRVKETVQ